MITYWAKINKNNQITDVAIMDSEKPNRGRDWLEKTFGGKWLEGLDKNEPAGGTAFSGTRGHVIKGGYYDPDRNAFIPPESEMKGWILNEETLQYEAPTPYPTDGKIYIWSNETETWELVK